MLSFYTGKLIAAGRLRAGPAMSLVGPGTVSSLLCGWGKISSCLQPGLPIQVSTVSVPGLFLLVPSKKFKTCRVTCSKQEGLIVHLIKLIPGEAEDLEA